jgi:quercetin dioxygenase-like cupin family protein
MNYVREIITLDDQKEEVKITWPIASKSVAHSHGDSTGTIEVLEGEVYENRFDKESGKFLGSFIHKKGDVFHETPDIIHIMGNKSDKVAITHHVYTPPLKMAHHPDYC